MLQTSIFATPSNELCKYASDTYLIIPASNVYSRTTELDNIRSWSDLATTISHLTLKNGPNHFCQQFAKAAGSTAQSDNRNHHIAYMSTWCRVISPFYDFCSFWCVAVNTMDKLQFLSFIFVALLSITVHFHSGYLEE